DEEQPRGHHAAIELLPVHVFEDICRHLILVDRGSVVHLARTSPGLYVPAISTLMRNVGRPVPMFRVKSDMVWRWFQMTDEDLHPWELYDWSLVCNPKNKLGHVGVLAAADTQAPALFLIAGTWAERGFHGIGRRGRDLMRIPPDLVRAMDLNQVEGLYLPRHLIRFDPRGPAPVVQTECYLRMAHVESLQSLAITQSSLHHDTLRVLLLNLPATLSTLALVDVELSCWHVVDVIPLLRPSLRCLRLAQVRGMRDSDWASMLAHFPDSLHTLELGPTHFMAAATLNALAAALAKLDRLHDLTLRQYYSPRADRDAILHVVASIPRNVQRLHLTDSTHIVDALVSHMPQRLEHLVLASTELQHDHLALLAAAFPATFQTLDLFDTLVWFRLDPGPAPVTDVKLLFMRQLAGTARQGFRARLAKQRAWVYIEGVAGHCHRFEYQSADRDGERTKFVRWQTSMYMLLWPYRIAKGVLGTFLFDRVPTSADVLRFIFGTTMLMLVRKAAGADGGEYEINAHNCKVRMARGEYQQELRSWSARFSLPATVDARKGFLDVAAGSMIEFIINGTRTSNPQRMLAVLHTYYCSALHPKLHVMAEAIMRKIEVDNITELYPSLEITRGLHDTLLHSEWSPIGSVMTMLNFFPVTKASLLTESLNWTDFTHTGIFLFKDTIPFAKFL
ncbi:hypothetical protein GGF31_004024, partial [Allomyces arbusculus]